MYDKNLSVEEIIKLELAKYDLTLGDLTDEQVAQFKDEVRFCQNGGTVLDGMEVELHERRFKKMAKEIIERKDCDYKKV